MLKLKNVSKFYYQNGIVTSGFAKVNLELCKGEFVAITGESGSGKSTLLNVISGLDSYEEGEMYINGEETSAYSTSDFENYRRKYIANIYQSFNLINSYTVYQNVELALMLSNVSSKERKEKIDDILKKVDLYKFRNTKASKLSGGQKQRVAIARALVKDTPIIVADEPTGNLDSESAANIIQLLAKLASDKLVIVVTHNYEQIEPYVTRKITMHDGRISEDLEIKHVDSENDVKEKSAVDFDYSETTKAPSHSFSFGSRIKLGFRNAFNVFPKFALLLFIFLFISFSVTSFYATIREDDFRSGNNGYNQFFQELSNKRIIIKKTDRSPITEDDFAKIEKLQNIETVYKNDLLLDSWFSLQCDTENEWYYFDGKIANLTGYPISENDLTFGRMPQNENEILLIINSDHYYNNEDSVNQIFACSFDLYNNYGELSGISKIKISGIYFSPDADWRATFLLSDELSENTKMYINSSFSTSSVKLANEVLQEGTPGMFIRAIPSDKVQKGTAIVSSDWDFIFDDYKSKGKKFTILVDNLYYSDSLDLSVASTYNRTNFAEITGFDEYEYDWNNGLILVNDEEYYSLFDKDYYQSSVFVKDPVKARDTVSDLEDLGYKTLYIPDALYSFTRDFDFIENLIFTFIYGIMLALLFLICYFIIRLIMKSRNVYFATIRMLGATKEDCGSLIRNDLIVVFNFAFIMMLGFILGAAKKLWETELTTSILRFMIPTDYIVLYLILVCICVLLAYFYSRQLFKNSAMNVYKEV